MIVLHCLSVSESLEDYKLVLNILCVT